VTPRRAGARLAAAALLPALVGAGAATPIDAATTAVSRVPKIAIVVAGGRGGTVSRALFGANLLWPYGSGGSFDAATSRFYPGFVAAVKAIGVTALRYPGGTTADSFHWERAIGPRSARRANEPFGVQWSVPSRLTNVLDGPVASTVGPDEFGRLLDGTGASGTVVVNFATGSVAEAADFVAYMTARRPSHPSSDPSRPSYWAALRARDGHPAPYPVTDWEVGNEQNAATEFGWRSGTVVSFGPHAPNCPVGEVATCLYAFGGTTRFTRQPVGRFADDMPAAARSTGARSQVRYVYYPPVVPGSERVEVAGEPWRRVSSLASAGPGAHVYAIVPATGKVTFGDGRHGAIPPRGATITASYESGPHGGFVEFYRAMKKMDPHARICESEQSDVAFLALMGRRLPYDCVELHEYAAPRRVDVSLRRYEEDLMRAPAKQGAAVAALEREVRRESGRGVPIVLTEYGQLVAPMPLRDPAFVLSMYEGVLEAAQLREWIDHGVTVADKYLLTSAPFLANDPRRVSVDSVSAAIRDYEGVPEWDPGLSIDSAMIAGPGPRFVVEPTGEVLRLVSRLSGARRLASSVVNGPVMGTPGEPALLVTAASTAHGTELLVVNASPSRSLRARVVLPGSQRPTRMVVSLVDGPSATAYNTAAHPHEVVMTTRSARVVPGDIAWTFPAHSVSLLSFR